jgi:hypothetical protein
MRTLKDYIIIEDYSRFIMMEAARAWASIRQSSARERPTETDAARL